jgi:hypothetical protein
MSVISGGSHPLDEQATSALIALLKDHDWDELIFGGYFCMSCTPENGPEFADDPDANVAWPCPALTEAGMTQLAAEMHIRGFGDGVTVGRQQLQVELSKYAHQRDEARLERDKALAEVERLRRQLSEAKTVLEGWEQTGETIGHFIPEHYEGSEGAFLAVVEEWATHAFEVVRHAQAWRKRRAEEDAAKLDAAVEKIYPSEDYL